MCECCAPPRERRRSRPCREWPVTSVGNPSAARPIVFSNQLGSRWSPRSRQVQSRSLAWAREHPPHTSGFQDHRIGTIELLSLHPPKHLWPVPLCRMGNQLSCRRPIIEHSTVGPILSTWRSVSFSTNQTVRLQTFGAKSRL